MYVLILWLKLKPLYTTVYICTYIFRDIYETGKPQSINNVPFHWYILPLSAQYEMIGMRDDKISKSKWYELLQFWTAKPAKLKEEFR